MPRPSHQSRQRSTPTPTRAPSAQRLALDIRFRALLSPSLIARIQCADRSHTQCAAPSILGLATTRCHPLLPCPWRPRSHGVSRGGSSERERERVCIPLISLSHERGVRSVEWMEFCTLGEQSNVELEAGSSRSFSCTRSASRLQSTLRRIAPHRIRIVTPSPFQVPVRCPPFLDPDAVVFV